jgi:hypothetical protein
LDAGEVPAGCNEIFALPPPNTDFMLPYRTVSRVMRWTCTEGSEHAFFDEFLASFS